jgi:hypothetical protein
MMENGREIHHMVMEYINGVIEGFTKEVYLSY